jgi:hypothetical protein
MKIGSFASGVDRSIRRRNASMPGASSGMLAKSATWGT